MFASVFNTIGQTQQKEKTDSAKLYRKIQSFSDKRQFTKFLYRLVFRPIRSEETEQPAKTEVKKKYYTEYEGKVIRKIDIVTVDPFGYDVHDTTRKPETFLEEAGNSLHIKSLPLSIRNRLIFKKHDTFDSLKVKESERLIRSQSFVREVVFYPQLVGKTDSVDIFIRVYDIWSIIAVADVSTTHFKINVRDRNFLGLGHQLENDYSFNKGTNTSVNTTNYSISNIHNTYISTTLHYDVDNLRNYNESVSFDRPFYSIFTQWAGGAYLLQHLNRAQLRNADSSLYTQSFKYNTQDYWLGKSWQLFHGHTEVERTTNLILSGRYYQTHFLEKPAIDSLAQWPDEHFYLGAISISKRKYIRDSYIFKYGYVEDVPTGRAVSLLGGYQVRNNVGRVYIGSRFYWGAYYKWGYVSSNIEYGTFLHSSRIEEECFAARITYFSPLMNAGRWRFRNFIKPQYVLGLNRLKNQSLSINDDYGISGFHSEGLTGTEKMAVVVQVQSYAPWNILGFRFGPYLVCSMGMLGNEASGFSHSPVYSQFGIGMLIKNEYLVFSAFEISVAFYPYMPGVGNSLIRVNPFTTTDFGFLDSNVGKPSAVSYQ